jgi:hypothetical protein
VERSSQEVWSESFRPSRKGYPMKLYFSAEDFNLLADILVNQGDPGNLLPRVMDHDLRFDFDELDYLRETLVANWSSVTKEIEACHDPQTRQTLEARQSKLENMIERVTESFAMF